MAHIWDRIIKSKKTYYGTHYGLHYYLDSLCGEDYISADSSKYLEKQIINNDPDNLVKMGIPICIHCSNKWIELHTIEE